MDRLTKIPLGTVLAAIAALAVGLTGCAGLNQVPASEAPPAAAEALSGSRPGEAPAEAPAGLPGVAALPRGTSATGLERFQFGAAFQVAPPPGPVAVDGTSLVFNPSWDGSGAPGHAALAWSVYRFNLTDDFDGGPLYLQWAAGAEPPVAQDLYIGFSNFERGTWLWLAGNGVAEFELPNLELITRDGGETFVALVVLGDTPCRLDWLRVGGNLAPTPALDVDTPAGTAPLLTSFDASGSIDLDGIIANYEWDLDGDLVFNEPGPEQASQGLVSVDYTYAATGSYHPAVRITDDTGAMRPATTLVEVSTLARLTSHTWGGAEADRINAITHDASGNTYMTGSTHGFGEGSEELLLLKYDPQGDLVWVRNWGGVADDAGLAITVREPGQLIIAGYTIIPNGGTVALLLEYGTDGTFQNSMVWGSC